MKHSVDIDALLAKDKLVLMLGGKTYEIADVPISAFMMTVGEDPKSDVLHKQLALILKVDESELKDLGLKAAALALKTMREWVTESGFDDAKEVKSKAANP